MADLSPSAGYVSGLYTDLRGRLVFYAAFDVDGGVVVAALTSEGPMRTVGDWTRLDGVTLDGIGSVGTLAAKLVVETDLMPHGRQKLRASILAARALGFVASARGQDVLPPELRCERWRVFEDRAGAGIFAAWSVSVPSLAPDEEPFSPMLGAIDRVVARWPLVARVLADRAAALPVEIVHATDDELAGAIVDGLLTPPGPVPWERDRAVSFVRSLEGVALDVDIADMVDLAGRLPVEFHPTCVHDLPGFDGASALFNEMRIRLLAPEDVAPLFAPFASDWTVATPRAGLASSAAGEFTAEDACDLLEAHVHAMTRRFGVPAWLEFVVPDFGDMPARTADSLVLSVVLALGDPPGPASAFMAELFLRDVDLPRLLRALRLSRTAPCPPSTVAHVAEVERNFRDAEAAGEFAGRVAPHLRAGGARRIGIELVDSGFGHDIDLDAIRREVGIGPATTRSRPRSAAGRPLASAAHPIGVAAGGRQVHLATRLLGSAAAGVLLALAIAGMSRFQDGTASVTGGGAATQARASGSASTDFAPSYGIVERRADMIQAAKLNPAPCPGDQEPDRICGRFGDLTIVATDRIDARPQIAGYVVEGRYPVEVFAWNSGTYRKPSAAWTRHLLHALDAEAGRMPTGVGASPFSRGGR